MGPTLFPFRRTRSGKAARRPAPRFRPRVEGLEDRLTPSGGQLDPTFGSGGIVNLPNSTNLEATAVAVQPDGKVVVAESVETGSYDYILVQRLNHDGSPDTTFHNTGSLTIHPDTNDHASALALQPDGKILVGGSWSSKHGGGALVARLNANGTLDTTFGNNGLWKSSAAGGVNKLAVLTDATHTTVTGIVAAPPSSGGFEAIKLTPAGVLDQTFGSGGIAFASLANGHTNSVAVAPSGEIYLAGYVTFSGMTYADGCIAALTPSGALDTTFGGGSGYALGVKGANQASVFHDVAVQTLTVNGQAVSRLLATGHTGTFNAGGLISVSAYVVAYTPGGALDTSFGSGGSFIPSNVTNATPSHLTLEADGSIVVEWQGIAPNQMLIAHLTANGAADTSFGSDGTGFVGISVGGAPGYPRGVAIDPTDGDIVACGMTGATTNSPEQAVVVRLTAP